MMLTAATADDGADRPGRGGQEPHHGRVRPAVDHVHRPAGHRPDHLDQRRPGAGARGPGRELQHRRVPRQDRRLRRAAPARPAAPGRRARPGRGQPAQHGRPGHDRRGGPAGRGPDHRHRRHRPARRGRSRRNVPAAGPEVPAAQLHEVRRFDAQWEREASVRLRDGDLAAVAAYDRHGRIRGADDEAAYDRAASMWLADHLRGKDVLLLAGSNAEAAELSRRVQAKLTQMGTRRAAAGPAVRRQPRRRRRPGPRPPQHRDRRRRPPAHQPRHAQGHRLPRARRRGAAAAAGRDLDRAVPGPPVLPRAQRRARLRRQRPRRPGPHRRHRPPPRHRLAVPAGPVRRHDPRPRSPTPRTWSPARPRRPGRAVPAGRPRIRARRCPAARRRATCPPPSRSARPRNGPAEPATCSTCGPPPSGRPCTRTSTSRSRPGSPNPKPGGTSASTPGRSCSTRCGTAQLAGHDIGAIIDRITAAPMDGARSISSVLHDRLQRLALPDQRHDVTWAQRTPPNAPALAHELAAGLDDRRRELGEQALENPEPWLTRHLGAPPGPDASPRCGKTTRGAPAPPRPTGRRAGSPTPSRR